MMPVANLPWGASCSLKKSNELIIQSHICRFATNILIIFSFFLGLWLLSWWESHLGKVARNILPQFNSSFYLISPWSLPDFHLISTWFLPPWKGVPGVAADPALAPVVVVLHPEASAVEGVVVLVLREIKSLFLRFDEYLWSWKANSPHGSSRWRFHHTSVLWAWRQMEEEER